MEQVVCFSIILIIFRAFEKFLIINDDYLGFGLRVALGIVMSLIDTIITVALIDEDVDHCKKAYEKSKKAKKSTFFDFVDGERVVSLHICGVAIFSKICLWSGLDFWRSFLIPVLVFGVVFVEICAVSGDLKKYNEVKQIQGQKKGDIAVFRVIDQQESQTFEKKYKTLSINYAKILAACLLFLRFTFYPYVNNCNDSWNMVNYLVLDLLLLYSLIKDYDQINEKQKYTLVAANLGSLCIYMNLKIIQILPFYLGMAYLMKKFGHKIFCFVYLFILILLNQYLTWLFHHHVQYQLHFVSKMCLYGITLTVFLVIYKTDRVFLIFAKLFKSIFQLLSLLIVLLMLSELESNSYGTDTTSFKIKQEFAFISLCLCIEVWVFVRIHLHYSTPQQPVQPKKPENKWKVVSQEEEKKQKEQQQQSQFTNFMLKILQISWKDDFIMKGQLKQIANFLVIVSVILLNMFFFNEKWILILLNYAFLNRYIYKIKGLNDAKLYVWHQFMYVFQFMSKYFFKKLYKMFLIDFVGSIFYWKKNLLTNLALNFAGIHQNIDGRSALLREGDDFNVQFHDIKNHHAEITNEEMENELVLMIILSVIAFISMQRRGREWKKRILSIRMFLIPLWVYILMFEEYDFYINCMAILQIVQTLDEQYIKDSSY